MRVAFLDHCARLSGAELALLRLLPELRTSTPVVVLGEYGPLADRLRDAGVEVHILPLRAETGRLSRHEVGLRLPLRSLVDVVAYVVRLHWHLRRLDVDLVHTNSLKSSVYGSLAGRLAGLPVVWHARDRLSEDYLPRPAIRAVRALVWLLPVAVVANSRTTSATLGRARRGQLRCVLPDPVDRSAVAVGGRRLSVQRAQNDQLIVGLLGRISPWKGQEVFLRAFAAAFSAGGARARIIGSAMFGEDDQEAELYRLCDDLHIGDMVELRGFREDVAAELEDLDVLVHCSTIPEPFGQVVVEGMAAGLPVVSTDVGGPAEIVRNGIDGILVPPGDVGALAAALRHLVDHPEERAALGAEAADAAAPYGGERVAERFDDLFVRAAALGRRGSRKLLPEPDVRPSPGGGHRSPLGGGPG